MYRYMVFMAKRKSLIDKNNQRAEKSKNKNNRNFKLLKKKKKET